MRHDVAYAAHRFDEIAAELSAQCMDVHFNGVAADFFALRKSFNGSRWIFNEGRNSYNSASHCDIAWAGALASEANIRKKSNAWGMLG